MQQAKVTLIQRPSRAWGPPRALFRVLLLHTAQAPEALALNLESPLEFWVFRLSRARTPEPLNPRHLPSAPAQDLALIRPVRFLSPGSMPGPGMKTCPSTAPLFWCAPGKVLLGCRGAWRRTWRGSPPAAAVVPPPAPRLPISARDVLEACSFEWFRCALRRVRAGVAPCWPSAPSEGLACAHRHTRPPARRSQRWACAGPKR
jgi:hypothetical protein